MYKFNVAFINLCTEAEGPFKRLAIWFQGCDKRCNGCCNPQLQEIKTVRIIALKELIGIIKKTNQEFGIEGITYLGGEPTLQQGLIELSQEIKKMGLGIILFTGKNVDELDNALVESVDLIIDGEFENNKIDNARNLIGSTNQKIVFVTQRYKSEVNWFTKQRPKQVEINVTSQLFWTGNKI